ncbi:ABC transporter substrate-binding protein [Herbiconiux sp. YIM B11900]|uniref:ABC transporter substrate-binding protein n=1 Tax=Herbiconiux sp. YIM B11900 TaxID=3404131 RepID=UPI003F86BF3D
MPSFLSRRRTAVAAAAVSLTAFALAGCSSPSAGSSSADQLTFQASWINDAEFSGYFTAVDKGYYTDEGLDLEYLAGGPSVIPESSLISGKADIALTSPDTTVSAIADQGADLVIIGTQYQQNPLGIVSLEENGIASPADLVGKTVAVPDVNRIAFDAMLTLNDIDPASVTVVPYAYDPTPLLTGEVDATLDFVTNVPFTIEQAGGKPTSFTLYDYGYKIPNDTVVVTRDTLENKADQITAFLKASRGGWTENLADPAVYPPTFEKTWFEGTGRTVENEIFFNTAQKPLIESDTGILSMSEQSIQDTIDTLALVGITATPDMFDMSLVNAIG